MSDRETDEVTGEEIEPPYTDEDAYWDEVDRQYAIHKESWGE